MPYLGPTSPTLAHSGHPGAFLKGGSLSFTAANLSFVSMGNIAALKVGQTAGTEASYSFWIKMNGNPAATAVPISTGGLSMLPHVNTSGIFRCDFDYPTAASTFGNSTVTVTDNIWHHCVVSHSDNTNLSKIYVDGINKLSTTKDDFLSASGTHRFIVGAQSTGATTQTAYFNGLIDEVRVYDKQLTDQEVTDLKNLTEDVASANLVGRWKLNEQMGTLAYDSDSTNHGTLSFAAGGALPTWSADIPTAPNAVLKTLGDTITIAEQSFVRLAAKTRALSQTASITEGLNRLLAKSRTLSQSLTIGETLARIAAKFRSLAAQSITISEALDRSYGPVRSPSDTITVGESIAIVLAKIRALSQTVTIGEAITTIAGKVRALAAQTVTIAEDVVRVVTPGGGGAANIVKTLTQTVTITEAAFTRLKAVWRLQPP